MMEEAFEVEDIAANEINSNRAFVRTVPVESNTIEKKICNPMIGT